MSGFESAIRGAISRAPDGRPETRARIYAAARASLERTLERVEPAAPDGDARRAALETTIERIEAEWAARTSRALSGVAMRQSAEREEAIDGGGHAAPSAATASVAPTIVPTVAPTIAPVATRPEHSGSEKDAAPRSPGDDERLASPSETVARGTPGDASAGAMRPAADRVERADGPGMTPEPSTPAEMVPGGMLDVDDHVPVGPDPSMPPGGPKPTRASSLDPALAAELAARDGPRPPAPQVPTVEPVAVEPRAAAMEGNAVPDVDEPLTNGPLPGVPSPDDRDTDPFAADPNADATPLVPPPIEVERPGPGTSRPAPKAKAKAKRRTPRGVRKRVAGQPSKPKRGRGIAWVVSLALVVGAGLLGYRWLDDTGMLEATEREVTPITTVERPPEVLADERPWTELMTRELAGAVEPLLDADALRVNGRAEVALDAAALAALGPEISVSLRVRAVGAPGEAAVSCDFPDGGCGRVRFPLPREAEERVIAATIGEGGEARLMLDAGIGGAVAPFDLLGVTARSR